MFKIVASTKTYTPKKVSNNEFIKLLVLDHTQKKNILIKKQDPEEKNIIEDDVSWEEKIFFDENKIKMKEIVIKELDDISINISSNQNTDDTSVIIDRRKKKKS